MQFSYDDTMQNRTVKSTLFLHADTHMFDWRIESANQMEVGGPFGTMPQISPTTIANKKYYEKNVHPHKS